MSEGNLKIKVEGGIPNDICQINQDLFYFRLTILVCNTTLTVARMSGTQELTHNGYMKT